ncbi:MAG TPA: PAS domain-containing protein [Burkholderiaceae bacterium]|nr:PAS domain-containing protein [Burkholderiaceae bacterium]
MQPHAPPPATEETDEQRIARLERALAGSHDGFWERNLRTQQSWYSPSFRAMFGFGKELPDDRRVVNARIHPDDIGGYAAAHDEAIRTLQPFSYEVRFHDGLGRWRWVRGRGRVWAGADGRAEIVAGALSDVTEAKEAALALAQMTERFEHAVSASDEGLFERVADEDAMFLSDRLIELLGYAPGELAPRRSSLIELMHEDDAPIYGEQADAAIERLQRMSSALRMRCKSGEYRWFRLRARAYRGDDGRIHVTGMLADIHEQVQAREEIEQHRQRLEELVRERTASLEAALAQAEAQRAEAERANETKSLFLAHMSHEMRTPLNGVLGLTDLALRVAQSPAQQRYLELSRQSGGALLKIIDDVLDFSRVAAGKLVLADEPFDLADLLAEAIRGVSPQLRAKGLGWRFDYEGAVTSVRGDRARLRQVITNLLGNAAKFTDHGHVAVLAQVEPLDEGHVRARLHVTDTGPGLDADAQARVFDAFVQGDASLARRHGGTGLGLSIARSLARAMGGELSLVSALGDGACFTLDVPLALGPQPALAAPADPGAARLMWLVYRQTDLGEWMGRRFERLHWRWRVLPGLDAACAEAHMVKCSPPARSTAPPPEGVQPRLGSGPAPGLGAEALPALVVVAEHVLAPGCDLRGLREALPDAGIALVIRPDWSQPELEQHALQLGMRLSVAPLTPRDLCDIAALAPKAGPHAATVGGTPIAGPLSQEGPPAATAPRVLLVEDNDVNRLIATELLQALGAHVVAVAGGEPALAACQKEPPELVLMDLQMPGMDGLEACRRLREMQRNSNIPGFPIIALTAHAMANDRAACLAAGMDGFLTKPIVFDALRTELGRWLPALA